MRFRRFVAIFMASVFVVISCVPVAHADWEDVVHKHVVVPFTNLCVHAIQSLGDIVQAGGSEIRDIVVDDYEFWTQWIRDESLEYREFVSTLDATTVSHNGLFEIYPGGWTMSANKWMNPSNIQSYAGGYDWEGYVLADPDDGTWEWFGVCAQAFSLPAGVYKLWFDDYYGDVAMSWSSIYYGRIPLYLDVCVDGVWSRPATVDFSEYSDDFPKSVTFTVPAGGYPTCVMRTDPNLQDGGGYRDYDGGEKIKFGFAGHIEAIELAESGSTPEPTTRTSSLMQAINTYNFDNDYTVNPTTINYMIGTQADDGSVTDVYSPALYDEETLVFTEPVTGTQYQTTGWKYDYNLRAYELSLTSGTFALDGNDITTIMLIYGDDNLIAGYYAGDNLVKTDTYAYVMVAQSVCTINGHSYTYENLSDPTCIAPGERKYTCFGCGDEYAEEIPMIDHVYADYTVQQQPDCINKGIAANTCTTCGSQVTEILEPLGHDWIAKEVSSTTYEIPEGTSCPDCSGTNYTFTRNGVIYACICSDCEAEWDVEADVTYGSTTYACSRCGETKKEVDATEENQESWFIKFISKFNWLSSVSKIYKQLVADVTSDAATAAAVADGTVALMDVTSGHAATNTYTAPELAISFGTSDKYGVDWANIKPLDLSWYAPHKETVDGILSGILWLSYLFLLIKRAPGIIRGSEMVTEDRIKIDNWRSRH